ncbi:MAG: S9 family peptidase [Erythrobacter sp.]
MTKFLALAGAFIVASPVALPASANSHTSNIPGLEAPAMSPTDLITVPRLGGVIADPEGQFAIYRVTERDPEDFEWIANHFLIDLETSDKASVPFDLGMDAFALAFGPDRFLYFLSTEEPGGESDVGYARLWRAALEADGNVTGPMLVADISGTDIQGFSLSPTGDGVALWAPIGRDCPQFGCPDSGTAAPRGSGRVYQGEAGFYRHWDQWVNPGVFNRVFAFDLVNGEIAGDGTPIDGSDPSSGLIANTPTMPFGGGEELAWAADGKGIYFAARKSDSDEPTSTDIDIYYSDLSGNAPVDLTQNNRATDTLPVPSPDGKYLAYLAMARPGYESDRLVIQLRNLETGETRALTHAFDRSFGTLAWTEDGSALLATASDVLDTPLFRIDPQSGEVEKLDLIPGNEAHIGSVTPLKGGQVLFTRDSIGAPNELFVSSDYKTADALSDAATTRMESLAPTVTTRFNFAGAEGDTVWGQITRLEDQTGPIPVVLFIHGGPQGSFSDRWSSRWNPRVVASQGFAVVSIDFHGSAGYGQAFMDAINRDWGGKPLVDLQLGLDAALKLDDQIDGSRACAMGASYGGYMVNWIAGNWPDRFNCLIQHDGLFDLRSFYYSTEELWFPRWDFGGSYSEARDTYERWNPVNHVDKWQSPMLVVTGERDFRVPYTQGLQSFTALQERGIPSQLLVFPDENHWVLGSENSLQWHNSVFAWLNRWLVEQPAQQASDPADSQ